MRFTALSPRGLTRGAQDPRAASPGPRQRPPARPAPPAAPGVTALVPRTRSALAPPPAAERGLVGPGHVGTPPSSSQQGARPLACFRFGGSTMTEPGASPEDPWVKASPVGAHAGEGRAGRARARRGPGRRGASLLSPKFPLLSGPRGCREDSSHPECAKVGRQTRRVCSRVSGRGCWDPGGGVGWRSGESCGCPRPRRVGVGVAE